MKRPRYMTIKLPFHRLRAQDCLPFQQRGSAEFVVEESVAKAVASALWTFFLGDCAVASVSEPSTPGRTGTEVEVSQYKLKRKKKLGGVNANDPRDI